MSTGPAPKPEHPRIGTVAAKHHANDMSNGKSEQQQHRHRVCVRGMLSNGSCSETIRGWPRWNRFGEDYANDMEHRQHQTSDC